MARFDMPVRVYMTRDVRTVMRETPIARVWAHLADAHVSSVPVVDGHGRLAGVVSRADLLREGRIHHPHEQRKPTLELPDTTAGELMLGVVVKVGPLETVASASETMVEQHIHRVYVEQNGVLAGVLSAWDVMRAVADLRVPVPISEIMTEPVMTVAVDAPLSSAMEALATGAVTGVVVVDEGWPAGVLTQEEALIARHHAPDTAVERVMGHEVIILPAKTPVYRAAAQAISMHVRRVCILGDRCVAGIVSGLDLVRVAADAR